MSIIVFEDKTRFFPYIPQDNFVPNPEIQEVQERASIIQQIYHPDFFDYDIHTLSGMCAGMDMFDALKKSNILDSSGWFYNIRGTSSDDNDYIVNSVRDILSVFEKYHKFSEKGEDENTTSVKEVPEDYDDLSLRKDYLRGQIFPYRFDVECSPLIPQYSKQTKAPSIYPDLLTKTTTDNEGYSFVNKFNVTKYSFSTFNKVPDNEIRNKNGVSYVVYRNTEEDTLACFQEDSFTQYEEYITDIFPELERLGTIHSPDISGVDDIIYNHPDKTSDELWNILQSECNSILPPDINPSRERIKSTIDKLYTFNKENKERIAFKTILKHITRDIYGYDTKPMSMTMRSIRRTLSIILKSYGLVKKREMGRTYYYGIEPKIPSPKTLHLSDILHVLYTSTQRDPMWLTEENISEYKEARDEENRDLLNGQDEFHPLQIDTEF